MHISESDFRNIKSTNHVTPLMRILGPFQRAIVEGAKLAAEARLVDTSRRHRCRFRAFCTKPFAFRHFLNSVTSLMHGDFTILSIAIDQRIVGPSVLVGADAASAHHLLHCAFFCGKLIFECGVNDNFRGQAWCIDGGDFRRFSSWSSLVVVVAVVLFVTEAEFSNRLSRSSSNFRESMGFKSNFPPFLINFGLRINPSATASSTDLCPSFFQNILPDGRYFCCVCNRAYKTHATLTAHLRGSHLKQKSPCMEPGCNHISYTEHARKKHQKMHSKSKNSPFSTEQTRDLQKLTETVRRLENPCENMYRNDFRRTDREVTGILKSVDRKGNSKFLCLQCDKSFTDAYNASRHTEIHSNLPKRCFYCGELRKGTIDLQVHYMRAHKYDGIRTFTCLACNGCFTSVGLFQNHATRKECELACHNLAIRQDVFYGELPPGTIMDQPILDKMNFLRERHEERDQTERIPIPESFEKFGNSKDFVEDIFDGSHSLIQTEFGLKRFSDVRNTLRTRPTKRAFDETIYQYHEEQQTFHQPTMTTTLIKTAPCRQSEEETKNTNYPTEYIQLPPSYGYDPLIGTYPDFQPMQQMMTTTGNEEIDGVPRDDSMYIPNFDTSQLPDHPIEVELYNPISTESFVNDNDLFVNNNNDTNNNNNNNGNNDNQEIQGTDEVFEELNKLDFVLPPENQNDQEDDLEDWFDF